MGGAPLATSTRFLRPTTSRDRTKPSIGSFRGTGRFRTALSSVDGLAAITQIDGWLLASILGLCGFGLVMVYSASEAMGYQQFGNANYFFERQLFWLGIGATGMIIAARTDYHRWQNWARMFAVVTVAMLALVIIPHIGSERFGARRWFAIGSFSIQPSAVATLMAIVFFARWLVDRGPAVRSWTVVRDYSVLVAGLLFLVVLEKDLGSTMVIALLPCGS